jgi:phosphoribosyl-ATP pyrophosphohydrolase
MADHATIAQWRAARAEMQWLEKMEEEAAEAWWESLSAEQREIFCELQDAHHGLYVLEQKIQKERADARKRREKIE